MNHNRSRVLGFVGLLAFAVLAPAVGVAAAPEAPRGAFGTGMDENGNAAVEARLLVDARAVAKGEPFRVGVLFELARGWHIYWRNPGGSGFPTRLSWTAAGAEIGPTQWPAPAVFSEAGDTLTAYGYADAVLLYSDAVASADAGSRLQLAVDADFAACRIECVPGRISLRRAVAVQAQARPAAADTHAVFEQWAARVPVAPEWYGITADAVFSQSAIRPGDDFRAAISLVCAVDGPDAACRSLRPGSADARHSFVPDAMPALAVDVTGSRPHPFTDGLLVTLQGHADASSARDTTQLRGVVELRNGRGEWFAVAVDLPLPRAPAGAAVASLNDPWLEPAPASVGANVTLWRALALALLGGLILNLMPCVLPVLAIKVFGIAERARSDRRAVLFQGGAYTLGILTTMSALAAAVIALRAAGTAVGWGFQFQEPLFVAGISALLVVFALNLFGVFEIRLAAAAHLDVGARASGARRSFFEGLLAVLLATPCSAPFLGTAVGFAFASAAPVIVAIFLAVGLGLAAPFAAITLVPGLARALPRSGPWMNHLRGALGFALLGTVVWLLWVFGQSVGSDGMTWLLGFLVALAVGVWIYGAMQRVDEAGRAPATAALVVLIAVAALVWLPFESVAPGVPSRDALSRSARAYDPAAVAATLAQGRPAFVSFTADWCLTCKVNERVVLSDGRIAQEMERLDFARFEADWTRRDESIRLELARFGRAGVPMYLVYDPRRPDRPQLLPELLTVEGVLDALRGTGTS